MTRVAARACLVFCLWLVSLLIAGPALAQTPLSDTDAAAIRHTVQSQLAAMAAGDAERAYAYAAPGIRQQFGNAATFMAMVRSGYPMVIKPAATTYFVPVPAPDGATQQLRLQDGAGGMWLAHYALVRLADGSWRIAGCNVTPYAAGRST